jgi:hypothetical protein
MEDHQQANQQVVGSQTQTKYIDNTLKAFSFEVGQPQDQPARQDGHLQKGKDTQDQHHFLRSALRVGARMVIIIFADEYFTSADALPVDFLDSWSRDGKIEFAAQSG